MEELTSRSEAERFRASLGSRVVALGGSVLVAGTPGAGAHTPWLFDLARGSWARLPEAPHPILSSAVIASEDLVPCLALPLTIAARSSRARAAGWMECQGEAAVGSEDFRLLRRDGAAQRARTSSSRLCRLPGRDGAIEELSRMPLADSYEHNGEIYPIGASVVCVGRDHVQAFHPGSGAWRTWPLPRELRQDGSSSWVKHCGSWALACLPAAGR
ncbi:unnamed protein product [Prorocentrum cordatum]|uniref:Uncharacterized protein n=1 Tax=Prorocentrum cordatum TaxID=2364126 RepID=A0ABN9R9A9_9DINO|nr:unnamed protein product [Polarella glacialis]